MSKKNDYVVRTITLNLLILVLYCILIPISNKVMFLIICFFAIIICLSINIKLYRGHFVLTTAIFPVGIYTYISIVDSYSYIAIFVLSQTIILTLLYSIAAYVLKCDRDQSIVIKSLLFFWHLFTLQMLVIILIFGCIK